MYLHYRSRSKCKAQDVACAARSWGAKAKVKKVTEKNGTVYKVYTSKRVN